VADIIVHSGPIKEGVYGSVGAFDSLVTSYRGIMVVVEYLCSEGAFGYAEAIEIIAEDSIGA
jgi:hypothetical protein